MGALATPVAAQNLQPWPTLQAAVGIAPHVSLSGESIQRISADDSRAGQWELRGYANYSPSRRLTLALGYGRIVTYQASGTNGLDNQVSEQATWAVGRLAGVHLISRTRLEQRFMRGNDGTSWRLREQLRGEVPLGHHAPVLVVWSEPFVVVRETRLAPGGLSMIRSFAGLSVPLSRSATAEIGYLNQYQFRTAGDLSTNAVPLIVSLRF